MAQMLHAAEGTTLRDDDIRKEIEAQVLKIVNEKDSLKEYEEIMINSRHPNQRVKVGIEMSSEQKEELIQFLKDHILNFTWTTTAILGIDSKIVVNNLNIDPKFPLIRQKARIFGEEKKLWMK